MARRCGLYITWPLPHPVSLALPFAPLLLGQKHPKPGVLTVQKALSRNLQSCGVCIRGPVSSVTDPVTPCIQKGPSFPMFVI